MLNCKEEEFVFKGFLLCSIFSSDTFAFSRLWYFIGVYKMNRTLRGHLEIRNFFPCVEEFFTRSLRSLVKYFFSTQEKFRISARPRNILYLLFIQNIGSNPPANSSQPAGAHHIWKTQAIHHQFIFLDFHSTKQGLPSVDSWSHGLD